MSFDILKFNGFDIIWVVSIPFIFEYIHTWKYKRLVLKLNPITIHKKNTIIIKSQNDKWELISIKNTYYLNNKYYIIRLHKKYYSYLIFSLFSFDSNQYCNFRRTKSKLIAL
jgi:hypothetical protein